MRKVKDAGIILLILFVQMQALVAYKAMFVELARQRG